MKKNIALIILLTIVATAKAQMEKGFKTPPSEMCSHVILGWDGEISPEVIGNDLAEIQTKGFPYVMIWQNTAGAPQFVCIEPWHGLPDAENTDHKWQNKAGMNDLPAGKEFSCEQNIWVD